MSVRLELELELTDSIHIDWSEGTVSDGAANSTSKSEPGDEIQALGLFLGGSHCDREIER